MKKNLFIAVMVYLGLSSLAFGSITALQPDAASEVFQIIGRSGVQVARGVDTSDVSVFEVTCTSIVPTRSVRCTFEDQYGNPYTTSTKDDAMAFMKVINDVLVLNGERAQSLVSGSFVKAARVECGLKPVDGFKITCDVTL